MITEAMPIALRIRQAAGVQLVFDRPSVWIGRSSNADLQLPDPSVSLRHASIRTRGRHYVITDEGSDNGVFVGESRVPSETPHRLVSGQAVRLGRIWLDIDVDVPEPPTSAEALKALGQNLVERALVDGGESPAEAAKTAERLLAELVTAPTEVLSESFQPEPPAPREPDSGHQLVATRRPQAPVKPALAKGPGVALDANKVWRPNDWWLVSLALGVVASCAFALAQLLRARS